MSKKLGVFYVMMAMVLWLSGTMMGCGDSESDESSDPWDTCESECSGGEVDCVDGGVSTCVEVNGCEVWSQPTACGEGESCLDGQCQSQCDEVCEIGDRECAGDDIRVCEYDATGCPGWSEPTSCGDEEVCSGGQCVSDCSDQCQEGSRQCSSLGDFQICQEQSSGCLDWSVPIDCADDTQCSDGACATSCTDDCTEGASQCTGDGFQLCVQEGDGCSRWTPEIDCPSGMNCQSGQCVSGSCSDECSDEGSTQCAGSEGFQVCQEQGNGCLGWSPSVDCPDDTVCSGDSCVTTCSDQCTDGATQCSGIGAVQVCETQPSGCLDWSAADDCDGGEVCDDGQCVDDGQGCSDVCTEGERSCDGDGAFLICLEQSSGCTDWSSAIDCPSDMVCDGGQCVDDDCSDACTDGEVECVGDDFQVCQQQSNGCTDWSAPVSCPAEMVCDGGACVSDCSDACDAGATQCATDGSVQVCQEQSNGCTDWSSAIDCPLSTSCEDGSCVSDCTDGCSSQGAVQCADSGSIEACQVQSTGCLDWSAPIECPDGSSCDGGQCLSGASCAPNTYRCNGDDVEVCNAEGTAHLFVQSCAGECDGGVCVGECEPGSRQCNGDTVEECNASGTDFEAVETCDTFCSQLTEDCAEDDWMVTSNTERDGVVVVDGDVTVFSGAELYSPEGDLEIHADSITVQSGGSIVMAATGDASVGRGAFGESCSCGQFCTTFAGGTGGSYGERGGYTGCTQAPEASGHSNTIYVRQGSRGGESRTSGAPGGSGGGVLRLMADEIDMRGTLSADGENATAYDDNSVGCGSAGLDGGGSGGGILMEADDLDFSGTASVQGGLALPSGGCADGDGDGGAGVVKLIHGSAFSDSGTVNGVRYSGLSSPRHIHSSTHPDEARYYNDDFQTLELTWQRPFPAVNGYYFDWNQQPQDAPDSGSGTWLSEEEVTIDRDDLVTGMNYIHFTSVDAQSNTSSMGGRFQVYINDQTPQVSSSSHSDELGWYDSQTVNLSWTDAAVEDHFTGYYYVVDQFGDTVPTADDQFVPLEQKSTVLSNQEDGVWAFHLVAQDTQGYLTRASETFVFRVGDDPGTGNILGNVFDADGNELAGAQVTINRGLLPEIDDQFTDSDGFFNFGGSVPAGDWEVQIEAADHQTKVVDVELEEGGNELLNLSLQAL